MVSFLNEHRNQSASTCACADCVGQVNFAFVNEMRWFNNVNTYKEEKLTEAMDLATSFFKFRFEFIVKYFCNNESGYIFDSQEESPGPGLGVSITLVIFMLQTKFISGTAYLFFYHPWIVSIPSQEVSLQPPS